MSSSKLSSLLTSLYVHESSPNIFPLQQVCRCPGLQICLSCGSCIPMWLSSACNEHPGGLRAPRCLSDQQVNRIKSCHEAFRGWRTGSHCLWRDSSLQTFTLLTISAFWERPSTVFCSQAVLVHSHFGSSLRCFLWMGPVPPHETGKTFYFQPFLCARGYVR